MTMAPNLPPAPITPEDLLRMPDGKSYELVDGKLVEKTVSRTSCRCAARIVHLLASAAYPTKIGEVYGADPGYRCFADRNKVRRPDASFITAERLAAVERDPGFMPIPADLAVEVISPNDVQRELRDKLRDYLEAGFPTVWMVDPDSRSVTVHRPGEPMTLVQGDQEITLEPALPGFRCKVSEFFAD